jgi:hypothetical protein
MALRSDLFKDDPQLKAVLESPSAHLIVKKPPIRGNHVGKIHQALALLQPSPAVSETEKIAQEYGRSTADAILAYKKKRKIINPAYQAAEDDIVGTMTIQSMDDELFGKRASRNDVMDRAFNDSRQALQAALRILRKLRGDIDSAMAADDPAKSSALVQILLDNNRNVEVLARRLLVPRDISSAQFRDALTKLIDLLDKNLGQAKSLFDAGLTGVCSPTFQANVDEGGVPFARTGAGLTPGKTHLCDPFFNTNRFQQRDVITHEICHLFGPAFTDHSVTNTAEGLSNPNTLAQIVARLNDRFRQANANGAEPDVPALPMP